MELKKVKVALLLSITAVFFTAGCGNNSTNIQKINEIKTKDGRN